MSRLLTSLAVLLVIVVASDAFNPYDVLNVKRSASVADIKRSYKSLVRKLHPDKNTAPDAEHKFIELNKAYELLLDPERRREYDRTGATEDSPNFRQRPDYSSFGRFDFDPFDTFTFTTGSGQQFHFNFNSANIFHKLTVTTRAYENNIVASSHLRPYLILFYGDLCFACFQMESLWQKIISDLEPLGVGFATIHSQHENQLARKLGVTTLPFILSLVDGETRAYRDSQISLSKMVDFIRRSLPSDLIEDVDDTNYLDFLNGWSDNRVRTLFVTENHIIKLRYLLVAFEFRDRIAFGHVTADENAQQLVSRYRVDHKMNSMLMFNEDITRTTATLSVSELKPQLMRDVLESNKFLLLPRLASQAMFDQLCPTESVRQRRRLCIVLVTNNVAEHEPKREVMREFMRENNYPKERFRFMYLFEEKQQEFVKALTTGSNLKSSALQVVVLWRREQDRVLYEWLPKGWDVTDVKKANQTKHSLSELLNKLVHNSEQLTNDAKVVALQDESMHSVLGKIVKKILIMTDNISDNISRREVLPAVSVVLSISFIVFIGYVMAYLVRIEEETIKEKYKRLGKQMPGVGKPKNDCKLNIHELRGETYNGLVRLLKPGCRTIVLLCDTASKAKLLPQFYRAVYPYRRNKTLMFAFLLVEKNLDWYKKLLMQTLGEHKDLHINPKNCIGTVVSLNGFRKYFCVYHAKHPEKRKPREGTSSAFMGFDDESSDDSDTDIEAGGQDLIDRQTGDIDDEIVFEEHLLDGLSNWLDRLFEGSTQRYHIQYWPEHMK